MLHRYTKEQIQFIRDNAGGKQVEEIQQLFNDQYKVNVTFKSIKGIMYRNGIKNKMQGYNTRFEKGHKSWCKGLKGINTGSEKGWFQKGNKPPSHKPVGTESVLEGYVWIKVAEPSKWVKKHHYIWEKEHGSIPDGYVLKFADENKLNVTLDNLFLTPRTACTTVALKGMNQDNPDLNKTVHKLIELEITINKAKKRLKG